MPALTGRPPGCAPGPGGRNEPRNGDLGGPPGRAREKPLRRESVPRAESVRRRGPRSLLPPGSRPAFPLRRARGPVPRGGGRRAREADPYLLLIRHPVLHVGHLGRLWPSPAAARGRPGRKPRDGLTAGAAGGTRPETPAGEGGAMSARAGGCGGRGGSARRPRRLPGRLLSHWAPLTPPPRLRDAGECGDGSRLPPPHTALATPLGFPPGTMAAQSPEAKGCGAPARSVAFPTPGRAAGVKGDPHSDGSKTTSLRGGRGGTSQSGPSRVGAAVRPFPPFRARRDSPSPGGAPLPRYPSPFPGPRPSRRPTSRPPRSQHSRRPASCPSAPPPLCSRRPRERQDGGRRRPERSGGRCGFPGSRARPERAAGLAGAAAGRAGGDGGLAVVRGGAGAALRPEGPAEAV